MWWDGSPEIISFGARIEHRLHQDQPAYSHFFDKTTVRAAHGQRRIGIQHSLRLVDDRPHDGIDLLRHIAQIDMREELRENDGAHTADLYLPLMDVHVDFAGHAETDLGVGLEELACVLRVAELHDFIRITVD